MIDEKNISLQIFGCLLKNPNILGQHDKYSLSINDFKSSFTRKLFATIYSLYESGAKNYTIIDIDNYLKDSPSSYAIWEKEHGVDFLQDAEELSNIDNFDYYYNKLKKINLLNSLKKIGYNISEFYEEDTLNPNYQKINDEFDSLSSQDILNSIRKKITQIEKDSGISKENKVCNANSKINELLDNLKIAPDTGARLQGKYFNTIVRGARRGKFFLRSAGSGIGKSRNMVGDACYLAYPIRYSNEKESWEWAGGCEKVLYIATEQEHDEIQTMILAYLSGINEDVILFGKFNDEQEERLKKAIQIMDIYKDNLIICQMSSPNIEQIQFTVRSQVLENDISYVFYDYIFSNPALLNEFRDLKVREDIVLGMFSSALKDLAVELGVFVMSATQVNAQIDDNARKIKNEGVIRGARSIVDKVDMGCVMARPTEEELNYLEGKGEIPNVVTDIYKMRRGRYTQVRIWSFQDLGTCRREDLFVTDSKFNIIQINNLKQEYLEDKWDIYRNLDILNCKIDSNTGEIELSDNAQNLVNIIEERKDDPFGGLL